MMKAYYSRLYCRIIHDHDPVAMVRVGTGE